MKLRCRKCRYVVADQETDIEAHEAPSLIPLSYIQKDYRSKGTAMPAPIETCTHVFLHEEVQWMQPSIREGSKEGILECPKCIGKLGTFNWVGIRCSCGAWVVPGFALLKSKIDSIRDSN